MRGLRAGGDAEMGRLKEFEEIERSGLTITEIAKVLGCSRQHIDHVLKNILKKLRPVAERYHLKDFL